MQLTLFRLARKITLTLAQWFNYCKMEVFQQLCSMQLVKMDLQTSKYYSMQMALTQT